MSCPDAALVLAAGLGTRFRPLSAIRAKAAVPLAGESLIRRIVRWLARYGVRNVVVNLHHRPETIAAEAGDGSDLGVVVRYSWEQPILGSAGGPRRALPLLDGDTVLIVNGDHLTDLDLDALAGTHAASGAAVTLALSPDWDARRYGGVALDAAGAVSGFGRNLPGPVFHFFGVQLAHRSVFDGVPDGVASESFTGVYPVLMADRPGCVRGYVSNARFWDVGTPGDYLAAALAVARHEHQVAPPPGQRASIHPSSRLVDTVVWDDVTIEGDCELVRCIVADRVRIPTGSRFQDAAIVEADAVAAAPGDRLEGGLLVTSLSTSSATSHASRPSAH